MTSTQRYQGSCHCGDVQFEVEADLSTVYNCNCSICQAHGLLLVMTPASQLKMLKGEDHLVDYRFHKKKVRHLFCKSCGVEIFSRPVVSEAKEKIALNVRSLKGVDLNTLNLKFFDGQKL